MSQTPDCIVIGAGIIGCAIALRLQRAGHRVLLLESDKPAAGASFGNAGMVGPNAVIPMVTPGFWRQLPQWMLGPDRCVTLRAHALLPALRWLWQCSRIASLDALNRSRDGLHALHHHTLGDWQQLIGDADYQRLFRPGCSVSQYPAKQDQTAILRSLAVRLRREVHVPTRLIDRATIKKSLPLLDCHHSHFTAVDNTAAINHPAWLVQTLVAQLVNAGGHYQRLSVSRCVIEHGQIAALACGEKRLNARHYVLAAGHASSALLPRSSLRLPLIAERGYHIMLKWHQPLFRAQPELGLMPCVLHDAARKCVISDMGDSIRISGFVEYTTPGAAANLRCYNALEQHFRQRFPGYPVERLSQWFGHRPSTPDSLPYIGRHPNASNLICAFGHGHYGMSGAPATARWVQHIIEGSTDISALQPYSLLRFGRPSRNNKT